MTSMRRRYVASTSLRRHVPAGNLAPPQYSKPSYAYEDDNKRLFAKRPRLTVGRSWKKGVEGKGGGGVRAREQTK